MGAWNEEPSGSDEAQEWLVNAIQMPIIDAIKSALRRFLDNPTDDLKKAEAEVASAFLLDLCINVNGFKLTQLNMRPIASDQKIWDIASEAINALLLQDKWISEWSNPHAKATVLNRILSELKLAKNQS